MHKSLINVIILSFQPQEVNFMLVYPISEFARRRITAALFLSQSFFSAAMITSFTLMPIIAAQLSGRDSAAGVPNTVTLLGRAAAAYPLGWVMDRAGRRLGLSLGYLLAVIGAIVAVLAIIHGSFIGFCLGSGLIGMGRGASEQSRYVAAEVQPADKRAKMIGLVVFAGTVGAVGGPLLVDPAGKLAERLALNYLAGPYVVGGVFIFLALILTFVLLRPDPLLIGRHMAGTQREETAASSARPLSQIFIQPTVFLSVMAMVLSQLVMTLIMVITPLHMDHHQHSTQAISGVIMAHTLGMFGLSGATGWLIDRYGRMAMILTGSLILIAATLLSPLAVTLPVLAFALFLLGLGWNFCFIAGSSLLSDALSSVERGRAQGASEVMVALASGAGSLGTGSVFAQGGMTAVGAIGLAFSLALIGVLTWSTVSRRLVQPDPG
jgi:MFS family permease